MVVMGIFCIVIVLPQCIHLQRQAKYFATLSTEDNVPCNQYLVGIFLPWLLACVLSHFQIFVHLVNLTSLVCGLLVAVVCSLLMWTTQVEETMVHETNFRESITMLVVQDPENDDSDIASNDDDLEEEGFDQVPDQMQAAEKARIAEVKKDRALYGERDALLKHQQQHANITAARVFLQMGEQRDSLGSLGGASGRSSLGGELPSEYINLYKSEKASTIGRTATKNLKGLTE